MGEYDKKPEKAASTATATAGPAQDDRYGAGKLATNLDARIIAVAVERGAVAITIAAGSTQGVRFDMPGYIKAGRGMLAEFVIQRVQPNLSIAFVKEVVPDQVQGVQYVRINPTSRPRMELDPDTRLIDVVVENGRTKITIPRGKLHGVTAGMTGELVSGDPHGGFTIDSVGTTRSSAYLEQTVEYARAHPKVLLHTSSRSSRSSPGARSGGAVQPRANGAAPSTRDVQSTAQAGVAGASSRLPHFDTIQRAFGKHDISGIQAQVGGPAADASRSLGAHAYATGNKVAFASAPDLHTAAHEAAHTIQQARGAVGFQGLGAADDEHERHADAVADAVVAGQSAEALLDDARGTGNGGAVQRKSTAPRRGPKLNDETIEARAIVSGLRAAQHELDDDRGARSTQATAALQHLSHCVEVAKKYGGTSGERAVHDAADSFDQAMQRFLTRAKLATRESEQLATMNRLLRDLLAAAPTSATESYHSTGGSDASLAIEGLPSVLHVIALRVESALVRLEGAPDADRNTAIERLAAELDESIGYAEYLLQQVPRDRRKQFESDLDLAADRMQYLLYWIRSRAGYSVMEQQFLRNVRRFDLVLLTAGAATVEKRSIALTEHSRNTGKVELDAFGPALQTLNSTLDSWERRQLEAVTKFSTLASLKDQEDPSFVVELLKSVFVAALGHFGGYLIGAASTKAAAAMSKAGLHMPSKLSKFGSSDDMIRRVVDVSTDSIQSVAGQALQATTKSEPQARARAFFVAGLNIDVTDRVGEYRNRVSKLIGSGQITPDQVQLLTVIFRSVMDHAHQAFFDEAVKAWTKYVAQSRLGAVKGRDVSDMKNYFGQQLPTGLRAHDTSRARVFSIRLNVDPAGTKPKLDHMATQVLGMNSEMKQAVLEAANFKLDHISLPKEVNIHTEYGRAVIALDETNVVRDVWNWSEVQRKVGVDSGQRFWRLWGKGLVLK